MSEKKPSLKDAVAEFLALIDSDGYSTQEYDDAVAALREASE